MYIHHAKNVAEGRPYSETGYIYNPAVPVYGPRSYPPVFPMLLVPLYKIFGLNLTPMKLEQVVFFVVTLAMLCWLWHRDLGTSYTMALLVILGMNPVFWSAKDSVLSDLPFLLFFYSLAIVVRLSDRETSLCWRWSFVLGLILYLVIGTRSAGIALFAGLPLYDVIHHRKIRKVTAAALAICIGLLSLQKFWLSALPVSYLEQAELISWHSITLNVITYSRALAGFWVASTHTAFSYALLVIVSLLIVAGLYYRRTHNFTVVEVFLIPYLFVVLLWPFAAGIRIVFPFIPWIVFVALTGLRQLSLLYVPRYATALPVLLLFLLSIPYMQAYRQIGFGPIEQGEHVPEFSQLADAIRQMTSPDDVLICYRARALSLYTGRPGSTYDFHGSVKDFSDYARAIRARYVIATTAFDDDHGFLNHYVEQNSANLELVYRNPKFSLYRIPASFYSALDAHQTPASAAHVVN